MPKPQSELLTMDEAADRVRTLAGSCFERRMRSTEVYCKFDTEPTYLAEVGEFCLRLSDECDMMVVHVVLQEVTTGALETWEVPVDDQLTVLASRDMHVIQSASQPYGLRLLLGDHEL